MRNKGARSRPTGRLCCHLRYGEAFDIVVRYCEVNEGWMIKTILHAAE